MAESVRIRLPAHLAALVKPDALPEAKRRVFSGDLDASPSERVTLLFSLCYDKDPELRRDAQAELRLVPQELAAEIAALPQTHPRLAEILLRLHPEPVVAAGRASTEPDAPSREPVEEASADENVDESGPADNEQPGEIEEEEFRSKYQLAQSMGVGDKIKMALTGDKEWRSILVKDSNKLVNGAVVKNPRITEPEILAIAKSAVQNDEIIRVICQNKEWVKNYEIRKALVLNHKTPLPVALRFMGFLSEKDLGAMAKSKNISSVLANQARRMLTNKKKS